MPNEKWFHGALQNEAVRPDEKYFSSMNLNKEEHDDVVHLPIQNLGSNQARLRFIRQNRIICNGVGNNGHVLVIVIVGFYFILFRFYLDDNIDEMGFGWIYCRICYLLQHDFCQELFSQPASLPFHQAVGLSFSVTARVMGKGRVEN